MSLLSFFCYDSILFPWIFQEKMLRTWIQYNRPSEPNFTHAGLLLAFGLHEHLRVLTMTDAYRYLSQVVHPIKKIISLTHCSSLIVQFIEKIIIFTHFCVHVFIFPLKHAILLSTFIYLTSCCLEEALLFLTC